MLSQQMFSVGKQLPNYPVGDSGINKQFLAAPIKSAVDKFQLLPEFLKVIFFLNFFIIYITRSFVICYQLLGGIILGFCRLEDW